MTLDKNMGCLRLTYEETPALFLGDRPEKIESLKWRVWVNPESDFLEVVDQQTQGGPLQNHLGQSRSLDEFLAYTNGCTISEVVNQLGDRSKTGLGSQSGGPSMRYVRNPHDGNVIDMRHMLGVGYRYGSILGAGLEVLQLFDKNSRGSAMDPQDFYSNDLGSNFWISKGLGNIFYPERFSQDLSGFFATPTTFNHQYRTDLVYDGIGFLKR